jgi:hypothetical protein
MTAAIDARHVTKIYRRFSRRRQFATLKSAILSGTLVAALRPDETFQALSDVSLAVPRCSSAWLASRSRRAARSR